jgi:hypothetical protein
MLSSDDRAALDKLVAQHRNFEIRRVGTTWHCEILVDTEPYLREGKGTALSEAIDKALEMKDVFYV